MKIISLLYERYKKEIAPALKKNLKIKNIMEVPKIEKISINVGIGSYLQKLGKKDHTFVEKNIELITGQKPVVQKARKSISNFKLREGQPVGVSVTLRGQKAYNFLDKLINVVYPRVRDFRGVNRNIFDKNGNCSLGFKEHVVFPEGQQAEDAKQVHGLQITIKTNTSNKEHAEKLLEALNFPFKKK